MAPCILEALLLKTPGVAEEVLFLLEMAVLGRSLELLSLELPQERNLHSKLLPVEPKTGQLGQVDLELTNTFDEI